MEDLIGLIVIAAIIVVVGIIFIFKSMKTFKTEIDLFKEKLVELGYTVEQEKQKPYDYKVSNGEFTFLLKLITIPQYGELAINDPVTYEVKYGAGSTPGKAQPYRKYLNNVKEFITLDNPENYQKVIVVSPKPKQIVMWINECEIKFVDCYTDVHGVRVISYKDYKLFENPLNIKNEDE